MEPNKAREIALIADKQIEIAKQYEEARRKSGEAEGDLKLILTSRLKELRGTKKNIGVEMAILMLMEENATAQKLYKDWVTWESKYKGLEKLLDAYASKLITEQAIMKYIGQGERWG